MKNKEKYREQIEDITFAGSVIAVTKRTGELAMCDGDILCKNCLFNDDDLECCSARLAWLNKDADEIDWENIPVDTLIEVQEPCDMIWRKRYFAGLVGGQPAYFRSGATSKTTVAPPRQMDFGGNMRVVEDENV